MQEAQPNAFHSLHVVRDARGVSGPEKAVLTYLALHGHGPTGERCYPSAETLADETCLGLRTVKRALASLEAKGSIRRGDQSRAPKSRSGGKRVIVWDLDLRAIAAWGGRRSAATPPHECRDIGATTARSKVPESPAQGATAAHELPMEQPIGTTPTAASTAVDGEAWEAEDMHLASIFLAGCDDPEEVNTEVIYRRMQHDGVRWPGRYLDGVDRKGDGLGINGFLAATGYAMPEEEWLDW